MAHTCGASHLLQRVPGMPGWPCCLLPGFSPFPSPWQSWLGSTAPRLGHPKVRAWPGAADGACLLFLSRKRPSPSGDAAAPERLEALKYQRIKKPKKSSKGSSKNRKQSSECEDPTVPSSVPSVPRGQLRLVPAGSSTGLVSGLLPSSCLPNGWLLAPCAVLPLLQTAFLFHPLTSTHLQRLSLGFCVLFHAAQPTSHMAEPTS